MSIVSKLSQKMGMVLCIIGVLYMIIMGWLSSWWIVPAIREHGISDIPGQLFFYWGISVPVGALLVTLGAAMITRVEWHRIWIALGGIIAVVAVLIIASVSRSIPELFGIGGGLIMLFFLGIVLDWVRSRPALSNTEKLGSDLRIVGLLFLLTAAWYLCGILGAPVYLLRPEVNSGAGGGHFLASIILVCLVLGWGLLYLGNRVSMRKIVSEISCEI